MKPKSKELLYLLLWACDIGMRPTFRNLTDSFEGWAYRNGLGRQLAELEKKKLLESKAEPDGSRLHRLTATGQAVATGDRDSVSRWQRRWDGKWRLVIFDVPQSRATDRVRLRRFLANRGFGYLQKSVWITPDPPTKELEAMGDGRVDVESLILLEAHPCAGESDEQIVTGAWDFELINRTYEQYTLVLKRLPRNRPSGDGAARELQRWFEEERLAWQEILQIDPLLPKCLHPKGYRGMEAWEQRMEIMSEAGRRVRSYGKSG